MKSVRAAACIAAIVLLSPTALAAQGLLAEQLIVAGETRLQGDATALFFESLDDGFSWEATADSVELVREYATYQAVDSPVMDAYDYFLATPWATDTVSYGASTLASSHTIELGAMLAIAQADAKIVASSAGLVDIRASRDPALVQGNPADAQTDEMGEIAHRFEGTFLDVTFAEGVYTLTGDMTLIMYGPEYAIDSGDEPAVWQTGEFETSRTAVYVEGAQERHTLTLQNAVLQLRASEPTTLLTTFPTIEIDGTLKAPQAEGALVVADQTIAAPADGSPLMYTGATTLLLSFDGGRVAAAGTPELVSTAAMIAPQGPPFLALGAGAVLLVAALAGAAVFWVRRTRQDDLALALLAMEERRWNDALPRLARVARREPDNVGVLVDRALCLEQVGRFEEAARAFETALRNAPALAEAHFYYARTLAKMRQPDAARAHLEEALERDPRLVEMVRAETVLRGL